MIDMKARPRERREKGELANNAARLIELFGGVRALARAIGADKATVSRWPSRGKRGGHGRVPSMYNLAIVAAANAAGLDHDKVSACLDDHACPACHRALEVGQTIDWPGLRKALGASDGV